MIRIQNFIFIIWKFLQISKFLCNVLKISVGGQMPPPLVARLMPLKCEGKEMYPIFVFAVLLVNKHAHRRQRKATLTQTLPLHVKPTCPASSASKLSVFPELCAAKVLMFWQNLLYVTSLPLQSLWRVGFYKVGVPRLNPVFIKVCRNEIKFEKRWSI